MVECLERYPSRSRELEPLLRMALNIQAPPAFQLDPAYKQSAKAQLLRRIRNSKPTGNQSRTDRFSFGLPQRLAWARIAVAIAVVVIVIAMVGGGTAYAAQSSLPGEWLYPVKMETEDIRLWVADNSADKAELNMEFSQARLVEMSKLANRDTGKIDLAVNGFEKNLLATSANIQNIKDASVLNDLLTRFSLKLQEQISYCDSVVDDNSGYTQPVQRAGALAVSEQVRVLQRLAKHNNLQAAQTTLAMMQNRLQRAQTQATDHKYLTMEEVLLQYQQFSQLGEQILQNTHGAQNQTTEIDKLDAEATQSYLETLDTMEQQVPPEYVNVIQASQALTLQFQTQARYQYQGGSQQQPDAPSSGNGGGSPLGPNPTATSQPSGDAGSTGNDFPVVTPTPTPTPGGSAGSGNANGDGGNSGTGGGATNEPGATPAPTTDTGSGYGNGAGGGAGTGGGSTSENSPGSTGSLRP
jgi:hypothetical protein